MEELECPPRILLRNIKQSTYNELGVVEYPFGTVEVASTLHTTSTRAEPSSKAASSQAEQQVPSQFVN